MKFRVIPVFLLGLMLIPLGCGKKVDSKKPVEKIRKEVVSMPVAELEAHAVAYAGAIRAEKLEIGKIQQQIQKMPMDKFFANKSMVRHITEIGQEAEALFERYRIYVQAFQERGGDPAKVQIEPLQS